MKRKIFLPLFFSAAFSLHHFAQAQFIVNGGFENWSVGPSGFPDPDGWVTNNGQLGAVPVIQGVGRTGNYSVCLICTTNTTAGIDEGQIVFFYNGNLKPIAISGYWKGSSSNANDAIYLLLVVQDTTGQQIATMNQLSPPFSNLANWTPFSYSINYTSSNTPTYTELSFNLISSSINSGGYVDDLTMTYVTDVGEIQTMSLLGSYISSEVTGNNFLSLNLPSPQTFTLNIFSADGKKVSEKNYSLDAGQHQLALPTENFPQGIYFCRVAGENINKSIKFIIQ